MEKRYSLESGDYIGDITLIEFLTANQEALTEEQVEQVNNLKVGESIIFVGGSAGDSTLKRVR